MMPTFYTYDTLFRVKNIQYNQVEDLPIKDIVPNIHELEDALFGGYMQIIAKTISEPVHNAILVPKNSIDVNVPSRDMYVIGSGRVVINSVKMHVEDIAHSRYVQIKPQFAYIVQCSRPVQAYANNTIVIV